LLIEILPGFACWQKTVREIELKFLRIKKFQKSLLDLQANKNLTKNNIELAHRQKKL
jgi:hypothetical protein